MGYEGEEVSGSWSTRTKTGRLCSEKDGKPIGMQKKKKKKMSSLQAVYHEQYLYLLLGSNL